MFSISSLPKHHHPLTKMDCDLPNGFEVCDRAVVCPDVRHDVRRTLNTMLLVPFAWCEVSPALYVLVEVPYARYKVSGRALDELPEVSSAMDEQLEVPYVSPGPHRRARGLEAPPRSPGGPPCLP